MEQDSRPETTKEGTRKIKATSARAITPKERRKDREKHGRKLLKRIKE
jgi:hypothetical protein